MLSEKQQRYFVEITFDGTAYCGWQIQPNVASVQETLEKAFSTILRQKTDVTGAGRTDTGVHALSYTAHFDADFSRVSLSTADFAYKINSILPPDIAIKSVTPVHKDAHARFSAVWRSYEYRITLIKNPFLINRAWRISYIPDLEILQQASQILIEYNDFECFSKSNTQVNNYQCKIFKTFWKQENNMLIFHITANRFLRNMVRAIVGTLMDAGTGKIMLNDLRSIIESKNRSKAGFSVPGCGLYFAGASYPEEVFIDC